jgi:hypothetical protein
MVNFYFSKYDDISYEYKKIGRLAHVCIKVNKIFNEGKELKKLLITPKSLDKIWLFGPLKIAEFITNKQCR